MFKTKETFVIGYLMFSWSEKNVKGYPIESYILHYN